MGKTKSIGLKKKDLHKEYFRKEGNSFFKPKGSVVTSIYQTDDYDIFDFYDANRDINRAKVNKLKKSIQENGYLLNPLIVNESYHILDGQHRFMALKELGMVVPYYILEGGSSKDCITLNILSTVWHISDYINYYKETDNVSYKYLQILYERYNSKLGIAPILNALNPRNNDDNVLQRTGLTKQSVNDKIKNGEFTCTAEEYKNACNILDFELNFVDTIRAATNCRKDIYYIALGFCYGREDINKERLIKVLNNRPISGAYTIVDALDEISSLYNYHCRLPKLYLSTDYQKWLDQR